MWYKDGTFYELEDTHVDFFLKHPEVLGFTKKEKREICKANGLKPDAVSCPENSEERTDILIDVLKRGAIRIRFYGGQTSVQCWDRNNKKCFRELQNCVQDGYENCFGNVITVMDCKGWGEVINDMGWGTQISDFISQSLRKPRWKYVASVADLLNIKRGESK